MMRPRDCWFCDNGRCTYPDPNMEGYCPYPRDDRFSCLMYQGKPERE